MRILFLTSPSHAHDDKSLDLFLQPLAGGYLIAEMLRDKGHEVIFESDAVQQMNRSCGLEQLVELASTCALVCISATSFNWYALCRFIDAHHRSPGQAVVVVGGVHASLLPDDVAIKEGVDYVVPGEGEAIIEDLLEIVQKKRRPEAVKGLFFKRDGEVVQTAPLPLMNKEELGKTHIIRWDDFSGDPRFLPVQTSRGCLMNCKFCSIPFRNNWRPFPVDHVIRSLSAAIKRMPGGAAAEPSILLADDCLTADRNYALELAERLLKEFPTIKITLEARVNDLLDEELLAVISQLNIQTIQVGVECGYDEGLRKIRKGLRTESVEQFGQKAHEYGLGSAIRYSYIVGFPWERIDHFRQTINFAYRTSKRWGGVVQINWWMLVPGNDFYREMQRDYGIDASFYERSKWFLDKECFFVSHPWLDEEDVEAVREYCSFLAIAHPAIPTIGSAFNGPWVDEQKTRDTTIEGIRSYFSGLSCRTLPV